MRKIKPRGADWEMLLETGYDFLDGDGADSMTSKIGQVEVMGTKPDFWARQVWTLTSLRYPFAAFAALDY